MKWNERYRLQFLFVIYLKRSVFVTSLAFNMQKDVLKQVDWEAWLYTPGMPPVDVINWWVRPVHTALDKLFEGQ